MLKKCLKGFTGLSIFHKYCYPLQGFDILNHLVYDLYRVVRSLVLEMLDKAKLDKQLSLDC